MTETRKLAAILAADVVGYSKLAGADEERLARLRALRSDLIDPTIAVHHGRVVFRLALRAGGHQDFRDRLFLSVAGLRLTAALRLAGLRLAAGGAQIMPSSFMPSGSVK
jgi:class 3 adenylate cyclase